MLISTIIIWAFIGSTQISAQNGVSRYFYTALSPYGNWIEIDYGVVVWKPIVMRRGWSPYTDGRWIWTEDGWYWDSYEPFGYVTYHYGRWYYDDYYGWLWVPGYQYAPAWVEWRYDDVYIGWAPLSPYATFSINIGIRYSYNYYVPYSRWNFVTYNYFYSPRVYTHCVSPRYRYRIYSRTKYRTNYTYYNGRVRNYGVDVNIVRRRSGQRIRQRDLIRTSDMKSITRNGRDRSGSVKTFYMKRDELVRNEVRDVKFKRSERKTSLDVSKIRRNDVGKRNNVRIDTKRKRDFNSERKINNTNRQKVTKDNRRDVVINNNRTVNRKSNSRLKTKRKNDSNLNGKVDVRKNNRKRTTVKTNRYERKNVNINKNNRTKRENTSTFKTNKRVTKRNNVRITSNKKKRTENNTRTRIKQKTKNTKSVGRKDNKRNSNRRKR